MQYLRSRRDAACRGWCGKVILRLGTVLRMWQPKGFPHYTVPVVRTKGHQACAGCDNLHDTGFGQAPKRPQQHEQGVALDAMHGRMRIV